MADTIKQNTSQFLGALSQLTKMTLGGVSTVIAPLSKRLPSRAGALGPSRERMQEWLDLGYETADQLLKLQHELLSEVVDRFAGAR